MNRRKAIVLGAAGILSRSRATASLAPAQLTVNGAILDVTFHPGAIGIGRAAILDWILWGAGAVSTYFDRFPVARLRLQFTPVDGRSGILRGVTYGGPPASTKISIGRHTTAEQLADDWVLVHELTHLCFPSVPRRHHWIEEGIATYVEPVARVQSGQMTVQRFWTDMIRDIPQGQPKAGDLGLDRTHTWARTYWGGALFCFIADVRIRESTANQSGLQQALRGILRRGGNIEDGWPLRRALEAGDDEVGSPELTGLYDEMKASPVVVDLAGLWRRLGIKRGHQTLIFDHNAPLADIRRAITSAPR